MWLVFRYALAAVRAVARERRELSLENIALRHQIEVLTRNRRRPQLQPADRLLWSSLSRMWPSWRRHIVIVQPDTVVRWHRTVWRRYWRWKSRGGRRGRPRIEPELAELIRRMTQENPRWGLWGAIIPNEANPDSDHSGSNIVALQGARRADDPLRAASSTSTTPTSLPRRKSGRRWKRSLRRQGSTPSSRCHSRSGSTVVDAAGVTRAALDAPLGGLARAVRRSISLEGGSFL